MNKAYSNKALPPGTILREWRLENVLGVGGFGIVYKGRGIYFDELVAIKEYFPSAISERRDGDTVVPTDSDSEEIHALGLKKFVEEAKLLWNLSKPTRHPNIVSVRSLFEIHGTAYMVMDFEDGVSLSHMLKAGKRFNEASLSALVLPIAEGLDRAHRVGVLHRDIKPPNILVSENGNPVLIDFGSARFDAGQATSTKVTFHTPPYAAIEQYVKTYDQGPWTDIYALGVVLYECVTGEKPPEVLERLHGGLGQALAEKEWPGYSKPFLRAVDAAMTIRPSDRPQSIPQWLTMFDADENDPLVIGPDDSVATRFAEFKTLSSEILPVAPLVPGSEPSIEEADEPVAPEALAALARSEPEAASVKEPLPPGEPAEEPLPPTDAGKTKKLEKIKEPSRGLRPVPIAVAVIFLIVVVIGAAFYARQSPQVVPAIPGLPSTDDSVIAGLPDNSAVPVVAVDATSADGLAKAIDGLAAAARKAGRSSGRISAVSARIRSATAVMNAPGAQPQPPEAVQAQLDQFKALAVSASAELVAAMAREADSKARQLTLSVPEVAAGGSSAAVKAAADVNTARAQMDQAKGRISAAAAAARGAGDPNRAIQAAHNGIAAYSQFNAAYGRMYRSASVIREEMNALPKRKSEFAEIDASARAAYVQITEMAKGGRPGLFASGERRDGWRTRQDNAAKAKTYLAELDQLNRSMQSATSVSGAESLIAQIRGVRSNLASLQSSSSAAMPKRNEAEKE